MKKLVVFLFFVVNTTVFGQMITTPVPLTIEANATNVDAGDFVVNWANNTENLLISVSLDYQSGATLTFPTTTGITRNTGYSSWTGITSIVFYGTRNNVNAALAAMTLSMGSIKTAIRINIEVSGYDSSYYYNPTNKHFYKYVSSAAITYSSAKSSASGVSFKGKTGYLVTITSDSENNFINNNISGNDIWIALTDSNVDGTWVLDAGPELGTVIKTQNGQTAGNLANQYNNWCSGEPNGANHSEDYAVSKWGGGTCWNDLPNSYSTVAGYIVEISADFPAGSDYTGVYASYIVHNNNNAYTLNSTSTLTSATVSNKPNLFGGLQVNDGHTVTLPTATTLNTNKMVFSGTGKIVFTDATSKWIPGTSSATNTFTHSPSTNGTPVYWSVSGSWVNDGFNGGVNYPHYSPWLNSYQGWSAATNDANQYIILNYNIPAYISGITTQGRANNGGQWVSSANVDVSMDGTTWRRVLTNVSLNTNSNDTVTALFPNVEYAKFVKVMPTLNGWYGHITMRLGLLIKQ
ncbi:MAG: discoidin domain-containing protein [Flavobacterium sp.]